MYSRREFISKISASALMLSGWPGMSGFAKNLNTPPNQGAVLRVALMGLGSYATRVANAMKNSTKAKLVGAVSGTPQKLKDWQSKYNITEKNCYSYDTFDSIKNNPDIDAVYVITPNALHKPNVIRAAQAGKNVICEKPMAINASDGQEMINACKKANVKLLVGYRMHFEPKTLEIIRQRNAGSFGKILYFDGQSGFSIGNPNQWRLNKELSGGGAMMDIGIYSVNGARYMIGEEPVWVTAQETKTNPAKFKEGVDETILFQLGFPGGAVASCLSTYAMNNLDKFFLNGDKGFAELQPAHGYGPIEGRTSLGELNFPHNAHQAIQMDEMASIILENRKPIVAVDGEEGLKDLKIIEAIYRAVKSGKKENLNL
jgi:predicted dehydrogenase